MKSASIILIFFSVTGFVNLSHAQQPAKRITIGEAISMAKNNLQYEVNNQQIIKGQAQVKTATIFPKTGLFAENEDLRPSDNTGVLKIGLSQSVVWPGLYKAQKNLYTEQLKYFQVNSGVIDLDIKRDVRAAYYQLWYLQDKQQLYQRLDSIFRSLWNAAIIKVRTGDSPGLDSISANVRLRELEALIQQLANEVQIQQQALMQYLNISESLLPVQQPLERLPFQPPGDSIHPLLRLQTQNINIANASIAVVRSENKPEFSGRFFTQRLWGASDPFSGFSVTASFPLFGVGAYKSNVRVAEAEKVVQEKQYEYQNQVLEVRRLQMIQEVQKNRSLLSFYETTGLRQAEEIIKASSLAYRSGEISFAELSQFLAQAIDVQKNYLENLNNFNQSVIQYNYYVNQ